MVWLGLVPTVRPDHVFADPTTAATLRSQAIEAYPVEGLGLSDHAPIVLELDLPIPSSSDG